MTDLRTLYWQLPNGYIGKGNPLQYEIAIKWLNYMKGKDKNIKYWIQ
jgi:hypothetical protein